MVYGMSATLGLEITFISVNAGVEVDHESDAYMATC